MYEMTDTLDLLTVVKILITELGNNLNEQIKYARILE